MSSSARHSTASAPCATAGSMTSDDPGFRRSRPALPSRSRPHSASTSASTSPASSLASRVLTLPRIGTIARSGRIRSNCARRRSEAVPTRAPSRQAREGKRAVRPTSTSRGSSRWSTQPIASPARQHRLHVLQRMHREVDAAVEQRLLDLLGEQALAADLGEQAGLHAVAGRADRHQFERPVGRQARDARRAAGRAQAAAWYSAIGLPRVPMRRGRLGHASLGSMHGQLSASRLQRGIRTD